MDLLWELLLLIFVCHESKQNDIKGFDDTVLFNIDWPGELLPEDADLPGESMIVTSLHQEKYRCILPTISEKESNQDIKYEGPSALKLISPLFTQTTCSFRLESYWTYEVCHGRYIRQYHEDREGKKIKVQEYILGKWDEKYLDNMLETSKEEETDENIQVPVKKIDNVNLPYFEVTMDNGTSCDLNNNKPRMTKVLYVCYVHGKHEVYSLKETSTCTYEIIILSPLLCAHPKYKPKETGEHKISCIPLEDSPKKPYSLVKLKQESAKLRRNSDLDRFRVELIQIEKEEPVTKAPEIKIVDPSPVESFLQGKNCLNGGTGWWKFEFCYGRYVEQYHVEKDGRRVSINLGLFNKKTHLDWIEKHPHKRPKPLAQRKQLSHFYSSGTVCDKTGKPRQTEVKLKCLENPSSPNAVSLYLLEPKYCEYILGVESPLICDILSRADEDGLVPIVDDEIADNENIPTINIKL
ncbi:endoplasmic reticulum lectin 1 [Anoplophora glabripennis]|uniref:endoplasmic reticulum lectin 1 n=1 Tax=Anoplophora glabripennis TaxID=217634 RepID=UPI000873C0CC|nr:endoplasmic reticulum lectin 1 [Anoplophora glabripennis]